MKKFIHFTGAILLMFFVWILVIPSKIEQDQESHKKYLNHEGYEVVELIKVKSLRKSAFYSVVDKETGNTDTLEIRYLKNGAYSIVY